LKWQVVTLHPCENFRLAIDEKLFQLGYQTIALPRVEDLGTSKNPSPMAA
jgi:hypothetical protein